MKQFTRQQLVAFGNYLLSDDRRALTNSNIVSYADVENFLSTSPVKEEWSYCQREIEGNSMCKVQCEHCKEYYKPLEQPSSHVIQPIQEREVYVPVSVEDELPPVGDNIIGIVSKRGMCGIDGYHQIVSLNSDGKTWSSRVNGRKVTDFENDGDCHYITHWLKKVPLSSLITEQSSQPQQEKQANQFRKKSLVTAVLISEENLDKLKEMGAQICRYNERSHDAFIDNASVGTTVIWTEHDRITLAQCNTIEGLHTAELPSMLMKGENGDMYFCTKEIFDKTYEPAPLTQPSPAPQQDNKQKPFTMSKVNKLLDAIVNEDGENLSLGSHRTIKMIRDELRELEAAPQQEESTPEVDLLKALLIGRTIYKPRIVLDKEERLEIWCERDDLGNPYFYQRGWGSALGHADNKILEIIKKPSEWRILELEAEVERLKQSSTPSSGMSEERRWTDNDMQDCWTEAHRNQDKINKGVPHILFGKFLQDKLAALKTHPSPAPMQEESTHYHVADNSDAFREWLTGKGIDFIKNGHFTSIPLSGNDIFEIGSEFGVYKHIRQTYEMAKSPVSTPSQKGGEG